MPTPNQDPAVAALPPAGDLYYGSSVALAAKSPGEIIRGYKTPPGHAQQLDSAAPSLMFGAGKYTGDGEPIAHTAKSSRGHWSEILNFHGSPAPWVLIGILLVAGILHVSAEGKLGGGVRV